MIVFNDKTREIWGTGEYNMEIKQGETNIKFGISVKNYPLYQVSYKNSSDTWKRSLVKYFAPYILDMVILIDFPIFPSNKL